MKCAVIGCGYVGLATGVVLAELGHRIAGVEIDGKKLSLLKTGKPHIYEDHLDEILKANFESGAISFTDNNVEACSDADVIIIAVGTPTRTTWEIDLSQLESAIKSVAEALDARDENIPGPLVVIKSTVPPGTSDYLAQKMESFTGRKFKMVANPEFLREGQAIFDTFYPDRIIVGASDPDCFTVMDELYAPIIGQNFSSIPPHPKRPSEFPSTVPVVRTSQRSAEMIKYASNAFLATKISFINEIANLCEEVGADVTDVAHGIGLDARIGPQFLRAGIGYGGSCFPKDTKALHHHAGLKGYTFTLLNAVIEVNRIQRYRFLTKIRKALNPVSGKTLGILGIAFKPGTDDIRESPSIDIMRELSRDGVSLRATDPQAIENAKLEFDGCKYFEDPYDAARGCDALIVVTEWKDFVNLEWERVAESMKGNFVFDGRNCLDEKALWEHGLKVIGVGR
jgi:UDPglucose 6-dehydrogenase